MAPPMVGLKKKNILNKVKTSNFKRALLKFTGTILMTPLKETNTVAYRPRA